MEISQNQCQREVIYHYWNQGIRAARVIQQKTGIGLSTIYYNLKKVKKDRKCSSEKRSRSAQKNY